MMLEQHIRGSRPSDYANSQLWKKRLVVVFIGVLMLSALLPVVRNASIQIRMDPLLLDFTTQYSRKGFVVTGVESSRKESFEHLTTQIQQVILRELHAIQSFAVTLPAMTRLELSQ